MKPRDADEFKRIREIAQTCLRQREPWELEWQKIADALLPYNVQIKGRRADNKAARKDKGIVNDMPCRALDNLSAGLMARITSPARKWFGLQVTREGTSVDGADVDSESAEYLDRLSDVIASDFQRGGWYATLSMSTYLDMAAFGTACIFADEQPDGSVVYDPVPVGRFAIDVDHLGRVDTYVREWCATAPQLLKRFGRKALPEKVKNCIDRNDQATEFEVVHAVVPMEKPRRGMKWSSTWWIAGEQQDVLGEGGFYEFPALVPRWTVRAGDVYGRGPGWKALGNIRMLQHFTRAMVQMIDRVLEPPMAMVGGTAVSFLPGAVTPVSANNGEKLAMERLLDIDANNFTVTSNEIARLEKSIGEAFFEPLWRSFTEDDKTGRTATEIEAKRQELALLTGPLLESLNGELLEAAVEMRIAQLARAGRLDDMPESLSGADFKVEFISVMHQMQQATALLGLRSFLADVVQVAQIREEVVDLIDGDAIVHEMRRASGVRADSLVSKSKSDKVRKAKAAEQQKAMQAQQALQFTEGMRNMASTDPTRLRETAGMLAPAAAAQGGALAPVA